MLKKFYRGIITKYVPPTSTRGSRIVAKDGNRKAYVSFSHAAATDAENHFRAVEELVKKYGLEWGNKWGYTTLETGEYIFFSLE